MRQSSNASHAALLILIIFISGEEKHRLIVKSRSAHTLTLLCMEWHWAGSNMSPPQ